MLRLTPNILLLVLVPMLGSAFIIWADEKLPPSPSDINHHPERPLSELPYHSGLDLSFLDKKTDPCSDFYTYACGGWQKQNPIPADQSTWSVFGKMAEENSQFLWGLLEIAAKKTTGRSANEQKLGDYFTSCMDEAALEKAGIEPIRADLTEIEQIQSIQNMATVLGRLHLNIGGDSMLFALGPTQDLHDATKMIASISSGGMGLPDRDYYLEKDKKLEETRLEYLHHINRMLVLSGVSPKEAEKQAQDILNIETSIAKASLTKVESRDPKQMDHRMSLLELQALTPSFSWNAYLSAVGAADLQTFNVTEPRVLKQLEIELTKNTVAAWKAYLRWHLLLEKARYLSSPFVNERFAFYGKFLHGQQVLAPRWKRCITYINNDLGEALGQLFVDKAFPADLKAKTLALVTKIEAQMESRLKGLSWMQESTKKQAFSKLQMMQNKIGYPDHFRDYSKLKIQSGDFAGNVNRSVQFEWKRQLAKIGKPVDRTEWITTPPTVNAYYNASMNDMNFPAGVLQAPMFDPRMTEGINFAKIGFVIGHELTHGFDDEGRQYDGQGNLKDWWLPKDAKEFDKRAQCIVKQYNQYPVVDNLKINGQLTLGENIADLGGLNLAYQAWIKTRPVETETLSLKDQDEFSEEQRFFISFAQWDCANNREEYLRVQVRTDPHSADQFRINGVLANMPEFQAAFHCAAKKPMVNQNRCQVW